MWKVGERDADRLITSQGRPVIRQLGVLLDRYARIDNRFLQARKENPDLNITQYLLRGHLAIDRRRASGTSRNDAIAIKGVVISVGGSRLPDGLGLCDSLVHVVSPRGTYCRVGRALVMDCIAGTVSTDDEKG